MFGFRSVVILVVVAVAGLFAGRHAAPSQAGYPEQNEIPGSGNFATAKPNDQQIEFLANELYKRRAWPVNKGYVQPVANPQAPGYATYPDLGAYKVHKHGETWHRALEICAAEGSTLTMVTSQREADAVKAMFKQDDVYAGAANNEQFWVGAQERGVHGQFYTLVGIRLEHSGYMVWSPRGNQPDDLGNTDCLSFSRDGTYFDDKCSEKFAFVCEKFNISP